jgi:clan AA aspartic protease
MTGWVDESDRALVRLTVKPSSQSSPTEIEAWIDTGFTGDLVLPQVLIDGLGLPQSGAVGARLADGSAVVMDTYSCVLDWFGEEKQIEVVANSGRIPLLGVGVLRPHKLTVDYPLQTLTIE